MQHISTRAGRPGFKSVTPTPSFGHRVPPKKRCHAMPSVIFGRDIVREHPVALSRDIRVWGSPPPPYLPRSIPARYGGGRPEKHENKLATQFRCCSRGGPRDEKERRPALSSIIIAPVFLFFFLSLTLSALSFLPQR